MYSPANRRERKEQAEPICLLSRLLCKKMRVCVLVATALHYITLWSSSQTDRGQSNIYYRNFTKYTTYHYIQYILLFNFKLEVFSGNILFYVLRPWQKKHSHEHTFLTKVLVRSDLRWRISCVTRIFQTILNFLWWFF